MIGSAIGAAVQIGGSIFGAVSASKAMEKYRNGLRDQIRDNRNWYERRYNEDATQRADAQRMITKLSDNVRERNRQAAGVQAVMGGTEESVAATKAANSQAMAEAASQIAAAGEARKDRIEEQYQARDRQLRDSLNNMEAQRAGQMAQAVPGMTGAAGGLGAGIDKYMDEKLKGSAS